MKYLEKYGGDFVESIEDCKDIIETFNESESEFKIARYKSETLTKFHRYKFRIEFDLELSSARSFDNIYFDNTSNTNDNNDQIDNIVKKVSLLTSKSKPLLQRISRYCSRISYTLNGGSIRFNLFFNSIESLD